MTIRNDILAAVKTAFEGIATPTYNNTVNTVVFEARDPSEPNVGAAVRPWVGIVPQEERWTDHPGQVRVIWPLHIIICFDVAVRTDAAMAAACSDWTADARKALYSDGDLGIAGVVRVSITGRVGSEGVVSAVQEGRGAVLIKAEVEFEEVFDS